MGSTRNTNSIDSSSKQPHLHCADDIDADTQSPSSSCGMEEKVENKDDEVDWCGETEAVDDDNVAIDETQLFNLYGETQVLDYSDCDEENLRTQLCSDDGDDEGEGSDRTEVVSDSGDESETEDGRHCCEQGGGQDIVVASNGEVCREQSSGSVKRSFMSVRAASLRASGRAASRSMTSKETDNETNSITSNFQSPKKHIGTGDGIGVMSDPTSVSTKLKEMDSDHEIHNCNGEIKVCRDDRNLRVSNSTVRKLYSSDEDNTSANNDGISVEEKEVTDFHACHDFAGLSYVGSEEPGELSQFNALQAVDKFILENHVELSQDVTCVKVVKGFSPPCTIAKGPQSLAKRVTTRSPVREADIYNWVDSHEDEGGGAFFSKRIGTSGRKRHGQKSCTQSKKIVDLNFGEAKCGVDNLSENLKSSNLHQNSSLASPNSKDIDKTIQDYENISEKEVHHEFYERLDDAKGPEQPLEANGLNSLNIYDVGPDTQMAAEAMEALLCAPPASYGTTENLCGLDPRGMEKTKYLPKNVSVQKRVSSSELGGNGKRSKRAKKINTKEKIRLPSREESKDHEKEEPQSVLEIKGRGKIGNLEVLKHLPSKNFTIGKGKSGLRSSKSIKQRRKTETRARPHDRECDTHDGSTLSNGNPASAEWPLIEDCRTFTPIACRTRRSLSVNPFKDSSSCNGYGEGINDQVKGSSRGVKRRGSFSGTDAPRKLAAERKSLGSTLNANVTKGKAIQIESSAVLVKEGVARTGNEISNSLNYPRGKRTRRDISGNLKKASNLGGLSRVADGYKAIELSVPRRKRSSSVRSLVRDKSTRCPARQGEAENFSSYENAERNCNLEVVPGKKPNAASITSSKCASSTKAVSPTCIEDDHQTRSYKKNQSKSSPKPELITSDAAHIPALKDLRRRRDMASVRVLLSHHLDEDIVKQQKKISARLGVSIVSSFSEATHFVTNKFARTRNMLEAIALGKPVVTHLWLESCGLANCFIDEKNYILRDSKKEKEIGFSMPVSLSLASKKPLLQGKIIFATPNIKPSKELIACLVRAVHGQVVESIVMESNFPDDLLILSCEEDYEICVPLLEKGTVVYTSELLLNGIVIQKLEYERHRLFTDHVKRMGSAVWPRRNGIQFRTVTKCK